MVLRPLTLNITPAAGGTVTITPSLVSGQGELGVTYTLKAGAKPGYFWNTWTAPGVSGAAATNATLSITMTNGLTVDAGFVSNLFAAGTYNGLAIPASGTTAGVENFGSFTGTLTGTTGSLSGKVNFSGTLYSFVALFDKVSGDASGTNGSTLSYNLHLDLTGGTDKITGTVTQTATGDVSNVEADFQCFSAGNKVPDRYLKDGDNTKNGIYNAAIPAMSQSGLATTEYPQGDGIATLSLSPIGTVSIAGTLADGTPITGSAQLSKSFTFPLAILLKANATTAATSFGGFVQFDTSLPDSDVTAGDLRWFRLEKTDANYYPGGWPAGIRTFLTGAKYNAPSGTAALPGLQDASDEGNALLQISDGLLTSNIEKHLNISTASTVSKLPPTDTSYTLSITTSTGALGGNFLHSGSPLIKPVIRGTLLQKGANAGGYGFFLSPVPAGATTPGQSGGITLSAKQPN